MYYIYNKNEYQKEVSNITNHFGSNLVLGGDFLKLAIASLFTR